jgi:hypothetical protein
MGMRAGVATLDDRQRVGGGISSMAGAIGLETCEGFGGGSLPAGKSQRCGVSRTASRS